MIELEEKKIIDNTRLLGYFKKMCDSFDTAGKCRLKNIYAFTLNKNITTKNIVKNQFGIELGDEDCERLYELIQAHLNKSSFRKQLSYCEKNMLLLDQNYKCAICGKDIHNNFHADHIIPFKYVGDELNNNWQMLCSNCNKQKNDSFDYQIRLFLNLL